MIVFNSSAKVIILKKYNFPDLRIFPEHNETDKDLLKQYLSEKINKSLYDEYCSTKKEESLNEEEKQQAAEAIQKNIRLNKIQNPALLLLKTGIKEDTLSLRNQIEELEKKIALLETKNDPPGKVSK